MYSAFGTPRYWALDEGKVYQCYGPIALTGPRAKHLELECEGLPSGVRCFSIVSKSGWYYMLLSRSHTDGEVIDLYKSQNGRTSWQFVENVFDGNYTGYVALVEGSDEGFRTTTGTEEWAEWPPRHPYFIEAVTRSSVPGHPTSYPYNYFRIWKIGQRDFYDEYGNVNNVKTGWTAYAYDQGVQVWQFSFEGYFQVDGVDLQELDIVQLVGRFY